MSTPSDPLPPNLSGDYAPTKDHTKVLILCAIVIVMGGFLFMQYLQKLKLDAIKMEGRAPSSPS